VIIWGTGELPANSAMDSDAGLFLRRNPDSPVADLMYHFYQVPFGVNAERLGYTMPEHGVCMTPNVPKARSRGRLYLVSDDPAVKPALDFRYFTDPEGHDERTIVDGLKTAREIAGTEPLRSWLRREVAPGRDVQGDEALSEYGRRVAHTVYHPAGTCAMGTGDRAVCDPALNVHGTRNLTIADASVFPTMPTANPMVPVLMIGERTADLLRAA
jgi:choline dehydrogenase